jgi:CBS-domain-containing membrane protein
MYIGKLKTKLCGLSPRANYTDQATRLSAKLVPTFANRGCHVVSVMDPYGHIFGFLDRYVHQTNSKYGALVWHCVTVPNCIIVEQ